MQKIKRNQQIDQEIIFLYKSGLTTYQVAEKIKCSQTCVINCLKQHQICRRLTSTYNTKYITNTNFFNKIDNKDKAYFLGLLYADGNNYIRKNHSYEVSIKLKAEDKYILEKLRDYLCPTICLKEVKDKRTNNLHYLLKINNKQLSEQLIKLGCVPNKSFLLKFPIIEEKFISHFIRGYFDGDGCLYIKNKKNYNWQITSTDIFCKSVKEYLYNNFQIHGTLKLACKKSNLITTTLSVGGNRQVRKLLDWMYKDSDLFLIRKYKKAPIQGL